MLIANSANAVELAQVSNSELSHVLANFQILAKTGHPESVVSVQVLKVQDHGECDGTPKSCPQSTIYIVASGYGEYPEQKVFKLPKRHNWEFVEWLRFTKYEGPSDYVELKLKAQIPGKDITKSWWRNEIYLINVNYQNGHWRKQ